MRKERFPDCHRDMPTTGRPRSLRFAKVVFPRAVTLAGVVLAYFAAMNVNPDPEVQRLIGSPPAVEAFTRDRATSTRPAGPQESPLVACAEAFALCLNPPKPVERSDSQTVKRSNGPPAQPAVVSPKFKLHGTSYYPSRPAESLALVWEPGSGLRWVRQGADLGHVTIKQVKGGAIVYYDGQQTHEMAVETVDASMSLAQARASPSAMDQGNGQAAGDGKVGRSAATAQAAQRGPVIATSKLAPAGNGGPPTPRTACER